LRGYLTSLTLLSLLVGCAGQPKSSGDKITDFENACVSLEVYRGDIYQAQACAGLADEMRARRAAQQAIVVTPAPVANQAPGIQWVATTDVPGLRFTTQPYDKGSIVLITASGTIGPGDGQRFASTLLGSLKTYSEGAEPMLALDSPGGSVTAAAKMAELVNRLSMKVVVLRGAECSSACVLVFAATQWKFVSPEARIGVHSAMNGLTGDETTDSQATTVDIARLYAQYGTPPEIIGRMVATPPSGVAWLSLAELEAWGVKTLPPAYDD
jgi:hypothetical protein